MSTWLSSARPITLIIIMSLLSAIFSQLIFPYFYIFVDIRSTDIIFVHRKSIVFWKNHSPYFIFIENLRVFHLTQDLRQIEFIYFEITLFSSILSFSSFILTNDAERRNENKTESNRISAELKLYSITSF